MADCRIVYCKEKIESRGFKRHEERTHLLRSGYYCSICYDEGIIVYQASSIYYIEEYV